MANYILIVDDGINSQLYNSPILTYDAEVTPELQISPRTGYDPYSPSHGTTCAAIIRKYVPDAPLGSIKVLDDDSHRGLRDQLVKALEWCTDNGVRLVNLSLGTIDFRDYEPVRQAVNYAYKKGVIIVAACNNRDIFTWPASLTNVIGVNYDKRGTLKEGEYIYNSYPADGVEITACGEHRLIMYNGEEKVTSPSNSFAAPMITARVYDIITKYPDITLDSIKEKLRKGAVNAKGTPAFSGLVSRLDWMDTAIVFDIGADQNGSHKPKNITGFDVPKRIYVACENSNEALSKIESIFTHNPGLLRQSDTLVICADEKIDEIGCDMINVFMKDLNRLYLANNDDKTNTAGKADTRIKNVALIHDRSKDCDIGLFNVNNEFSDINMRLWHPAMHRLFYKDSRRKPLDIPLITIHNFTGNSTVDAAVLLKDMFRNDGYYAVGASDTSRGVLYGLEYVPYIKDLEVINAVYDADLIVYGKDSTTEQLEVRGAYIQPDMRLIIFDEGMVADIEKTYGIEKIGCSSSDMEALLQVNDANCETILVVKGKTPCSEARDGHILYYTDYLPMKEIYKHVIELFEKDEWQSI